MEASKTKLYEFNLKAMKAWNDKRASDEKKAMERFYKLKYLLHPPQNNVTYE